ncbi:DMT family transporter [Nocardioides bruguierae]|uniref:DMT family transporter n=1 Tax=Nocardioides bruguierae TaxID=2945102 RepID=UPI002021F0B3|nr:DMT family transporter [Nocardioides bruguierae]MCL8023989.1 DMT family transporter [Nocardioides bruguierae]
MSSPPRSSAGLVQVCLAGVLWGTGGLTVTLVRERVPMNVVTASAWRLALAALVLLVAVVAVRQSGQLLRLLRERPGAVALVGLSTTLYQTLYFAAVVLAGVSVATVISLGLAPVLLTVVEAIRHRRPPDRWAVGTVTVALVGLLLVSTTGHGAAATEGGARVLGVLLALAAGAAYAFATDRAGLLAGAAAPLPLTTATTGIGAVVLVPVALLTPGPHLTGDPGALALLVYLGVFTMALSYALLYAGLRTTTGSAAVVATLLEPVTAAVAAALLLGERLGPAGWAGTVLVLLAVAGLARVEPRAQPVAPPPGGDREVTAK